jgi:hypothetical protein
MTHFALFLAQAAPRTPETQNYMIYGYVFGLGIMTLIVLSIWWRYRNLAADEVALKKLEADIQKDEAAAKKSNIVEAA